MDRWACRLVPTPTPILALTQGVALGDHACFDVLHGQWNPVVRAWIAKTIPRAMHEAYAGDIEQEVWLRVIRRLRPIDSEVRFERWLRSVTLNAARDRLRHEVRRGRRERVTRLDGDAGSIAPEAALDAREEMARLVDALRSLDAEVARLVDLRMRTDATLDRLGGLVGLTPGALDGRVRRALRALRRQAEAEEQLPEPRRAAPMRSSQPSSTVALTEADTPASTGGRLP